MEVGNKKAEKTIDWEREREEAKNWYNEVVEPEMDLVEAAETILSWVLTSYMVSATSRACGQKVRGAGGLTPTAQGIPDLAVLWVGHEYFHWCCPQFL